MWGALGLIGLKCHRDTTCHMQGSTNSGVLLSRCLDVQQFVETWSHVCATSSWMTGRISKVRLMGKTAWQLDAVTIAGFSILPTLSQRQSLVFINFAESQNRKLKMQLQHICILFNVQSYVIEYILWVWETRYLHIGSTTNFPGFCRLIAFQIICLVTSQPPNMSEYLNEIFQFPNFSI